MTRRARRSHRRWLSAAGAFTVAAGAVAPVLIATPSHAAIPVTRVHVTAGRALEFDLTLSAPAVELGRVTFLIHNLGHLEHRFKICLVRTRYDSNFCSGRQSPLLVPGASARLTVVFRSPGIYEYLCSVPGHASAGMKGQLDVVSPRKLLGPT